MLTHFVATLTQFLTRIRRETSIRGENVGIFCVQLFGQVYGPISSLGKDMRRKRAEQIFQSSSMSWRFYASEVAILWSFQQQSNEEIMDTTIRKVNMVVEVSGHVPDLRAGWGVGWPAGLWPVRRAGWWTDRWVARWLVSRTIYRVVGYAS